MIICCACFVYMPVLMHEQPYHAEAPLFHPCLCTNSLLCSAYTGQPNWTLGLMCLGIVQIAKHKYSLTLAFLLNISIFFKLSHSQISAKDTGRIFLYIFIYTVNVSVCSLSLSLSSLCATLCLSVCLLDVRVVCQKGPVGQ